MIVAVSYLLSLSGAIFVVPEVLNSQPISILTDVLVSPKEERRIAKILEEESETLAAMSVVEFVHEIASRAADMEMPTAAATKPVRRSREGCKEKRGGHKLAFLTKKHRKFDAFCKEGLTNVEMTVCCQRDCGECHDTSDVCVNADVNGRGSTCCPSTMLAVGDDLPSCEFSHAPCAIPKYVRAPPKEWMLRSGAGVANAEEDCGEAIPDADGEMAVATQYLKLEGKEIKNAVEVCTTTYGDVNQIGAACGDDQTCLGFMVDSTSGEPGCLVTAGIQLETLEVSTTNDLYLKRQTSYGEAYEFRTEAWGDCSLPCGNGTTTRTYECSVSGISATMGMCSHLTVMNEDALPATTGECNVFQCNFTNATTVLSQVTTVEGLKKDLSPIHLDKKLTGLETTELPVSVTGYYYVGESKGLAMESENIAYKFKVNGPGDCFPPPEGSTVVIFESTIRANDQAECDKKAEFLRKESRPLGICQYHLGAALPEDASPGYTLADVDAQGMLADPLPSCGDNVLYFAQDPVLEQSP